MILYIHTLQENFGWQNLTATQQYHTIVLIMPTSCRIPESDSIFISIICHNSPLSEVTFVDHIPNLYLVLLKFCVALNPTNCLMSLIYFPVVLRAKKMLLYANIIVHRSSQDCRRHHTFILVFITNKKDPNADPW